MTSTSHSLVLGAFTKLPPSQVAPFAQSLKATGYRGSFCVVAAGYSPDDLAKLRSLVDDVYIVDDDYDVSPLPRAIRPLAFVRSTKGFRRFYPYLFDGAARWSTEPRSLERWQLLEYHLEGLQALRYGHYYRYLINRMPEADFVFLTDLRDVIFQADPFDLPVDGLELYLEDEQVTVGSDHFNTRWLRHLYGAKAISALTGRVASCSGTVIGTRAAMLTYLAEMIMAITWRRRPLGPHDQGVHNWLIAEGRFPGAKLVPNGFGRVLTMGAMRSYQSSSDGTILNANGSIPPVLHQFDRHHDLAARFRSPATNT